MNKRLYYTDPYTTQFEAHILERIPFPDQEKVGLVLDQTYFYPTSGGQPHDTGRIQNFPVVDVYIREDDDAIVHVVNGEIWAETVRAEISWLRRFEHMQQHTGQHILTRAFIEQAAAETASFHLGSEAATIDLDRPVLSAEQIEKAEWQANQIIWDNRLVRVTMVSQAEAQGLSLRKLPPELTGRVRLIDIENYDVTACGGTHVSRTGEVGLLKITSLEKRRNHLRIHFRCGRRALRDYRIKNRILNQLSMQFTTGIEALEQVTTNLREENQQAQKEIRRLKTQLRQYEIEEIIAGTRQDKSIRIIRRVFNDREVDDLRALARELTNRPGVIALLGLAGARSFLVFSRSTNAPGNMNKLIKPALQLLGTTAGGGTPEMAQGGGPPADEERLNQALAHAERLVRGQL
jgi:alanyl-tRNA synthetase